MPLPAPARLPEPQGGQGQDPKPPSAGFDAINAGVAVAGADKALQPSAAYTGPKFTALEANKTAFTYFAGNQSESAIEAWGRQMKLPDADMAKIRTGGSITLKGGHEVEFIRVSGKPSEFAGSVQKAMTQLTEGKFGTVISVGEQLQVRNLQLEGVGHPERFLPTSRAEIAVNAVTGDGPKGLVSSVLGEGERIVKPGYNVGEVADTLGASKSVDAGHSACNKIFSNVLEAGNDNAAFLHVKPQRKVNLYRADTEAQGQALEKLRQSLNNRAAQMGGANGTFEAKPIPNSGVPEAGAGRLATVGRILDKGLGVLGAVGGGYQFGTGVQEWQEGNQLDGAADMAGGFFNSASGIAGTLGKTVFRLGAAPLAGLGSIAGGAKDYYNSVGYDAQGNVSVDRERAGLGTAKTLGGTLMLGGAYASTTGLGAPVGAVMIGTGAVLQVGSAVYENWDGITTKANQFGLAVGDRVPLIQGVAELSVRTVDGAYDLASGIGQRASGLWSRLTGP